MQARQGLKMKKLPPYGKVLLQMQIDNNPPTNSVYIFVGERSFKKAAAFQTTRPGTLALKAYECPSLFNWPVKGCDILIFDTGFCQPDYLNDLAYYLYEFHATKVRCVLHDFSSITFDN